MSYHAASERGPTPALDHPALGCIVLVPWHWISLTGMNVDPVPQELAAAHDLLRDSLTLASDDGCNFGFGFALYPRPGRFDAPVFGVLTVGGESTTLTYRMLRALEPFPVYLSGRVPATIREGMALTPNRGVPAVLLDQPVLRVGLTLSIGPSRDDLDRTMPLESLVFAGDLRAPIVLLTDFRPEGWPP